MDQAVAKNNSSTLIAARFRCGRDNLNFTIILSIVNIQNFLKLRKFNALSNFPLSLVCLIKAQWKRFASEMKGFYATYTFQICTTEVLHLYHKCRKRARHISN